MKYLKSRTHFSLLFLAAFLTGPAFAGDLEISGFVDLRASSTEAARSWRDGGFGRLDFGEERSSNDEQALGQGVLVLDWHNERWRAVVHGSARAEPSSINGDAFGLFEAFVEARWSLREHDLLKVRAGHFLLPTSRENVETGWSSPYTLTFSALNTWIGEEVRPTGLELGYKLAKGTVDELIFDATIFGGNDSNGALLAWRGFSMSNRLTGYGEFLPLPPLLSLAPGGGFAEQRDDGSKPFGRDLDDRYGHSGTIGWQRPQRASFRITRYDNRGDKALYRGEYAWHTRFDLVGGDFHFGNGLSFAAEWLDGRTGMGIRSGPHVDMAFTAAYLLGSFKAASWRATLRYDLFETEERDGTQELNDEDGEALTAAFFFEPESRPWRIGLEYVDLDGERPAARQSGGELEAGGRMITLEFRFFFGN